MIYRFNFSLNFEDLQPNSVDRRDHHAGFEGELRLKVPPQILRMSERFEVRSSKFEQIREHLTKTRKDLFARVREDPLSLNAFCSLFSTGERQTASLLSASLFGCPACRIGSEIESHASSLISALLHYSRISTAVKPRCQVSLSFSSAFHLRTLGLSRVSPFSDVHISCVPLYVLTFTHG